MTPRWPSRNRLVVRPYENRWAVVEVRRGKSDRILTKSPTKRDADRLLIKLRSEGVGYA